MADHNKEDGCLLPAGAKVALPGHKFAQSAVGSVLELGVAPLHLAADLAVRTTEAEFARNIRDTTNVVLGNIDSCKAGSHEGRMGYASGAVATSVALSSAKPAMVAAKTMADVSQDRRESPEKSGVQIAGAALGSALTSLIPSPFK